MATIVTNKYKDDMKIRFKVVFSYTIKTSRMYEDWCENK